MGWSGFVSIIGYWIRVRWRLAKSALLWFSVRDYSDSFVAVKAYDMKTVSMNDVGTRMEHLAELHKLWSDGIGIMTTQTHLTEFQQQLIIELEICLKHLENHMAKDYVQTDYAVEINKIGTNPPKD